MGERAGVAASRFVAAVRRGRPDLRADALDGRVARWRFSLRVSQGRRCRAARAELAAAHDAGGLFFLKSIRIAGIVYVLTILEWITRHAGYVFVILAWIFVVCRILQAYVHVTSNTYRWRSSFYSVGAVVLMVMWVIYIVEVLSGGSV